MNLEQVRGNTAASQPQHRLTRFLGRSAGCNLPNTACFCLHLQGAASLHLAPAHAPELLLPLHQHAVTSGNVAITSHKAKPPAAMAVRNEMQRGVSLDTPLWL
jgi:hypothetical protein